MDRPSPRPKGPCRGLEAPRSPRRRPRNARGDLCRAPAPSARRDRDRPTFLSEVADELRVDFAAWWCPGTVRRRTPRAIAVAAAEGCVVLVERAEELGHRRLGR